SRYRAAPPPVSFSAAAPNVQPVLPLPLPQHHPRAHPIPNTTFFALEDNTARLPRAPLPGQFQWSVAGFVRGRTVSDVSPHSNLLSGSSNALPTPQTPSQPPPRNTVPFPQAPDFQMENADHGNVSTIIFVSY